MFARDWDDLVRALRSAMQGPLPDPLIQLHDLRRGPRPYPLRGVLVLAYKDDADIPHLLKTVHMPEAISVENHQIDHNLGDSQGLPERTDAANVDTADMPEEPTNASGFTDAEMGSLAAAGVQVHTPTETEMQAALRIQSAYRGMLLRRSRIATTGREPARRRFFEQCLTCTQDFGWKQNSYYRLLFLGPLPHLLLCLEISATAIAAQKTKAKKRLSSERHQALDDLSRELTKLRCVEENGS
jgi:hypothetical protein